MRIIKIVAFISFISFTAKAQNPTEVLEGYYIDLSGDTIRGNFPSYRQREFSPEKIDFASGSGQIELTPANARFVSVGTLETWISYTGPRVANPMDLKMLTDYNTSAIERFDTVTVFLRYLGQAKEYSFYMLNDKLRRNFYYSSDGTSITELRNHMYKVRHAIGESKVYVQQILNILNPDANLAVTINRLEYTEESFNRMLKKAGYTSVTKTKKPAFTIIGGLSLSTISDVKKILTPTTKFNSSLSPLIGLNFTLPVDRNFNKYFFYLQVKAFQYNHKRAESTSGQPAAYTRIIKSTVISPALHFGYNFVNKPAIKAFISPGIAMNVSMGGIHTVSWSTTDGRTIMVEETENDNRAVPEIQGGVSLLRLMIWAGYSFPANTNTVLGYRGMRSSFQLGTGIRL
jgi:hypothetical protein